MNLETDRHGIVEVIRDVGGAPEPDEAGRPGAAAAGDFDVIVEGPDAVWRVPGFRDGAGRIRARLFAPAAGDYTYRFERREMHDAADSAVGSPGTGGDQTMGDLSGSFSVEESSPGAELRRRGRLRVAADRTHLEWTNGEPFFWLGDTWWMGFSPRIDAEGFAGLCRDRVAKGFSVVQIVAGLFPDMPPLDRRGANAGGTAWEPDFAGVNPRYFDEADERIRTIVDHGLVPCIVGCWGYYLSLTSHGVMRAHWEHLIARYAAYPVVFCLAGETRMPYYLSATKDDDRDRQREGWTTIARFVRETDPYGNPLTTHPDQRGREQLVDPSVLDFEMLQTGHGDRSSLPFTVEAVRASRSDGEMPVIDSEVCYEGIGAACREDVQRYLFWICMLNGACGHTYGANGLWQANTAEQPYGPSPHGMEWGDTTWQDAMSLPGSAAVGRQKRFLESLSWWTLQPCPDLVAPSASPENPMGPHAARTAGGDLMVVYLPSYPWQGLEIKGLAPEATITLQVFDPVRGTVHDRPARTAGPDGVLRIPGPTPDDGGIAFFPIFQDWLLVARGPAQPHHNHQRSTS